MNKRYPVCMNKNILFQGINSKSLVPGHSSLVMSGLDSGHGRAQWMAHREHRGRHAGLVTRGQFHNSSDLTREMKQQSLSRAFNPGTPWVKTSATCQLRSTLNLSWLLPNTYTVRWQRTKEVGSEAWQRGKDERYPTWQRCEHVTKRYTYCLFYAHTFTVTTSARSLQIQVSSLVTFPAREWNMGCPPKSTEHSVRRKIDSAELDNLPLWSVCHPLA